MDIKVRINGKEQIIQIDPLQDRVAAQARVVVRDDKDGWPDVRRAKDAMLKNRSSVVPAKRWTKRPGPISDPLNRTFKGCGPGSNTVKGIRAAAGLIRAINASSDTPDNGTGCIVATKAVEERLQAVPIATTDPANDGQRFTDDGKMLKRFHRAIYGVTAK